MDPMIDDINQIIYLLAEHKKGMANLYTNYYQKFTDFPYWQDLAQKKQNQYTLIQTVYFDSKNKDIYFDQTIFRSAAIKTSLEWVNRLIAEYIKHSLINAISYALDLEQSRIEQRYFDIFKSKSPQIEQMIPGLEQESRTNIELLRCELEKIKQMPIPPF